MIDSVPESVARTRVTDTLHKPFCMVEVDREDPPVSAADAL